MQNYLVIFLLVVAMTKLFSLNKFNALLNSASTVILFVDLLPSLIMDRSQLICSEVQVHFFKFRYYI